MKSPWVRLLVLGVLGASLALAGCGSGSDGASGADGTDGATGPEGPPGPAGGSAINGATAPGLLEGLDVECTITNVTIASPPVVTFTLFTDTGLPIVGMEHYFDPMARSPFYRFTLTKLVAGTGGLPDSWVAYVLDDDGEPTYDHGTSLVGHDDGSYDFTFETDVDVVGAESLTHRVAGQVGRLSVAPLEEQNPWLDFLPAGGDVTEMRNIAVMDSCNECHDNLRFHGRRFKVEYCVNCHNPDLAEGEGDMAFMTHRIHASGAFETLDGGIDYEEVTYPQDLANCRKCHNGDDAATPQGDNWRTVENTSACFGCHAEAPEDGPHGNWEALNCFTCHDGTIAVSVDEAHVTANATPNNPDLFPGQRNISYKLLDAAVDGTNQVIVHFQVFDGTTALDVTDLATVAPDLASPGRYPGFLLAWAEEQDEIEEPADYNNMGRRGGQPLSLSLAGFSPIETVPADAIGTMTFGTVDDVDGVLTATITDPDSQFPTDATLRAVGLQGYFQQDLSSGRVSLHTLSAVVAVDGDDDRRAIVDSMNCGDCHEWFEGHGGNRVGGARPGEDEDNLSIQICTLCHLPNQSSSGRTINPTDNPVESVLGPDILDYPEDAQNFKDLIHGIHSEGFRTRHYEHVRGPTREGYYDWSHITFPRGASTSNCMLCHKEGSYELPLDENLLATTVRTTAMSNGQDNPPDYSSPGDPTAEPPIPPDPGYPFSSGGVEAAFQDVPNDTDWVNTATASSCFYCHTSADAMAHMMQNGALLSLPDGGYITNREELGSTFESCAVCHGPGKTADLDVVHNR